MKLKYKIPVLSYSSISTYLECPRKFLFSRIYKIPMPPSRASDLGSAIHWLLHRYYSKQDIAPDKEYPDDIMKIAQRVVQEYINKYKLLDDFKVIATEEPFNFKRKGVEWTGIIDMIINRNNKIFVVDHKYSSRRFKESFIALNFQGALYYYYLSYIKGMNIDGIIWNTIYSPTKLLKNGEPSSTIEFIRYETRRSSTEIENMWQVIDDVVENIKKQNFLPHISRITCEHCPYIEQCIALQKGFDF